MTDLASCQVNMASSSRPQESVRRELIFVSPIRQSGASSPNKKRHITPSSEASSPKRIAVAITFQIIPTSQRIISNSALPNPLRLPSLATQFHIDARCGLPVQNPLSPSASAQLLQLTASMRHVVLPFDLRDDPKAINDRESRDILFAIFPNVRAISSDGYFICFSVQELPPRPWPQSVAGLPAYILPQIGNIPVARSPLPFGTQARRKNGTVADDQNGRNMKNWTPLFNIIRNYFQAMDISITEVIYWASYVVIVLEHRDTNTDKLPWKVANIQCFYTYDDEMGRPSMPQACRLQDPTSGHPDNAYYHCLQPGLRVTSDYLPSRPGTFLSTTTGVLVRDEVGNEFMTVAAHGFPSECGTKVTHPVPTGGRDIGKLIMELAYTDIALVKLHDTEKFSNTMFQTEQTPEPVQLKRLVELSGGGTGINSILIDSPDTGCIDGSFVTTSFCRIPSDDFNEPEQQWIFSIWNYMGQDSSDSLRDGICGSPIWTEAGEVLGFFRYAPQRGLAKDFCIGIAADELIKRGFILVYTANEEQ